MAPLRFFSEAMGAEVEWVQASQQVIIRNDDIKIVFTIGSKEVLVNNIKYTLDTAPILQAPGITFAPIRFVCEMLGGRVDYNNTTREITITFDSITVVDLEQGKGLNILQEQYRT